jgi:AcrR family transcriptional regulator
MENDETASLLNLVAVLLKTGNAMSQKRRDVDKRMLFSFHSPVKGVIYVDLHMEGTTQMPESPRLDPRVKRTRQLLQDALLALMAELDLSSITVQDIARRAEVNRATFYLHHRDKDDLVDQTLDALFDKLTAEEKSFVDTHSPLHPAHVPVPLVNLFRALGAQSALYRRLLSEGGSSAFIARLQHFHEQQFMRLWPDVGVALEEGDSPPEFRARFAASAIQGAMSWWLEDGQGETPEAVADWLWQLIGPLWFSNLGPGGTNLPGEKSLSVASATRG